MTGVELLLVLGLAQQPPPTPRPFPQPGTAQPSRPPQQPPQTARPTIPQPQPPKPTVLLPTAPNAEAPTEEMLGVKIYPGAQYLTSYDAGRGQRFYLFGSTTSFLDLVKYYRTLLKKGGDLVFDAPATHEFELGNFREETMAFPPSVTIKEYKSEISEGYPNPKPGGQPARFPTIIQIVPAPPTGR